MSSDWSSLVDSLVEANLRWTESDRAGHYVASTPSYSFVFVPGCNARGDAWLHVNDSTGHEIARRRSSVLFQRLLAELDRFPEGHIDKITKELRPR